MDYNIKEGTKLGAKKEGRKGTKGGLGKKANGWPSGSKRARRMAYYSGGGVGFSGSVTKKPKKKPKKKDHHGL